MIKLIIKILALISICLFIMQILRLNIDKFWAGKVISNKETLYQNILDELDLIFVGTSRVNHGINPFVVDSIFIEKYNKPLKSFNWGISGATFGEIDYVLDYISTNKGKKLKHIILELPSIYTSIGDKFCKTNLRTNRNIYWQTFSTTKNSILNTINFNLTNYSKGQLYQKSFNYITNYFANLYNVGMLPSFIKNYRQYKNTISELNILGYSNIYDNKFDDVLNAKVKFTKNPKKILNLKKKNSNIYFTKSNPPHNLFNSNYLQYLINKIIQFEKIGIKLIIITLPMMNENSYEELGSLFWQLPENNTINFTNAKAYPQFYNKENIWDGTHFNNKGAKEFSILLAKKINKKMNF